MRFVNNKLVAHTGLEPVISALRERIGRFVPSWPELHTIAELSLYQKFKRAVMLHTLGVVSTALSSRSLPQRYRISRRLRHTRAEGFSAIPTESTIHQDNSTSYPSRPWGTANT